MKKISTLTALLILFPILTQAEVEIPNPRYFYDKEFLAKAKSMTDAIPIGRWVDHGDGIELDFNRQWLNYYYQFDEINIFEIGDDSASSDLCIDFANSMWCVSDLFFGYTYPPTSFVEPKIEGDRLIFKAYSGFEDNINYTIFAADKAGTNLEFIEQIGSGVELSIREDLVGNYPLAKKNIENLKKIIPETRSFTDLPSTHSLYNQVLQSVEEGWIAGYPDQTIRLENTVNRAEFAKMLALAFGNNQNPQEDLITKFADLEPTAWYRPFLAKAVELGLMSGYPDGSMKPAQTINVAEASKMLLAASGQIIEPGTDVWYQPYRERLLLLEQPPTYLVDGQMDYNITRGDAIDLILKVKEE